MCFQQGECAEWLYVVGQISRITRYGKKPIIFLESFKHLQKSINQPNEVFSICYSISTAVALWLGAWSVSHI